MPAAVQTWVLRIATAIARFRRPAVGVVSIFFQPLMAPLFDVPARDPAMTMLAGGELIVVSLVYVALLRDPVRLRPLYWIAAADQVAAIALPLSAVLHGYIPATLKILGPMPLNALLVAIFVWGALRRPANRAA